VQAGVSASQSPFMWDHQCPMDLQEAATRAAADAAAARQELARRALEAVAGVPSPDRRTPGQDVVLPESTGRQPLSSGSNGSAASASFQVSPVRRPDELPKIRVSSIQGQVLRWMVEEHISCRELAPAQCCHCQRYTFRLAVMSQHLGTKSSLAAAQAGEERKRRNANCDPETERFLMKQCAFDSAGGRGAQAAGRQL